MSKMYVKPLMIVSVLLIAMESSVCCVISLVTALSSVLCMLILLLVNQLNSSPVVCIAYYNWRRDKYSLEKQWRTVSSFIAIHRMTQNSRIYRLLELTELNLLHLRCFCCRLNSI